MNKAIIISGNLAQDHEFIYPYYRLLEAEFEVDVCLLEGKPVKGILGTTLPPNKDQTIKTIDQLKIDEYKILILPGGVKAMEALGKEFRTPGHIPLCRESPGGLSKRQGHTELAVAIARLSGNIPCTIGAEMLDPDGDGALSLQEARKYAKEHGIPMITGNDILESMDMV